MLVTTVGCLFILGVEVLTTGCAGVVHGVMGVDAVVDEPMPTRYLQRTLFALAPVLLVVTGMVNKHTN